MWVIFMIRLFEVYKEFRCVAGRCGDSCCMGWKIIVDDASAERYVGEKGEIGDRVREVMIDDGKKYFRLNGSRCPFLNKENLCDIYIELGEEALCETCSSYPRVVRKEDCGQYGELMEACLTMSCPEAARLMMEKCIGITEVQPPDNMGDSGGLKAGINLEDSMQMLLIDIARDKRVGSFNRVVTIIMVVNAASREKTKEGIENILDQFRDLKMRKEFMDSVTLEEEKDTADIIYELMEKYFELCDSRINVNSTVEKVKKYMRNKEEFVKCYGDMCGRFNTYMEETGCTYRLENLLLYYIFRHYKEVSIKNEFITMMCVYYVIARTIQMVIYNEEGRVNEADSISSFQYYSKITEHSVKDYNKMLSFMQESDYNRVTVLIRMVSEKFKGDFEK